MVTAIGGPRVLLHAQPVREGTECAGAPLKETVSPAQISELFRVYDTEQRFSTLVNRQEREDFWLAKIHEAGGRERFFEEHAQVLRDHLKEFAPHKDHKAAKDGRRDKSAYEVSKIVLEFLDANLDQDEVIDDHMAARLVSGLMTALYNDRNNPRSTDEAERFGYRLKDFLLEIGGAKIAQLAHSFIKTPKAWKKGLDEAKYAADPLREDAFMARYDAVVPADLRRHIQVAEHRGSGSYLDTRSIKLSPDYIRQNPIYAGFENANFALQLVKPGSGERSLGILKLLVEAFEHVKANDKEGSRSIAAFIPIAEHAAENINEESHLTLLKAKNDVASKLYEGLVIEHKDADIHFGSARMFDHNDDYRIVIDIQGDHFNDLKCSDDLKQVIAKAIFMSELYMLLSGKPFDHDRHGHNQGIRIIPPTATNSKCKIIIGNFDEGAISTQAPTTKQKELFAQIIMDALINSSRFGFSPGSSLTHTFARYQEQGKQSKADLNYANAMIKSIISLLDYVNKSFGRAKFPDVLDCIRVVMQSKELDEVTVKAFRDRFRAYQMYRERIPVHEQEPADVQRLADEKLRVENTYFKPTSADLKFGSDFNSFIVNMAFDMLPAIIGGKESWGLRAQLAEATLPAGLVAKSNYRLRFPEGYQARFAKAA